MTGLVILDPYKTEMYLTNTKIPGFPGFFL